jgi:hypothetical protein
LVGQGRSCEADLSAAAPEQEGRPVSAWAFAKVWQELTIVDAVGKIAIAFSSIDPHGQHDARDFGRPLILDVGYS